ncbi:dienelactone hydrolase family protein [Bradyrhizobium ontarionense]|uniref:Dienelactone hydrolase family protein n=1 Tax=Bradyrhizobium ontarionense TaxID=2898149 RepID=A0ABY3RK53_9BRAD|nr:dienelactone hydrolase family protein [Bradyrhizobium sp. A19]UFZ07019.1 dienelactone hydrolase family protein [Bradyrhizobium sp. A19]
MYRILCLAVAAFLYGMAAGLSQPPQAGTTTITFQSATYGDMRQLLAREATTGRVTIKATLVLPEQVKDQYPAIVVVHTLAGYRDANEGYVAAELRKAGFATLTYDSFAARGTTGAALQGSPGYLPIGVADAYAALRFLSGDSRIDAGHIAIIGFSYGAEVAHLAAMEPLRSALNPGPERFVAHVAFYPGGTFGAIANPGAYTGSPILMLLGDKDDNLPLTKVHSYLAYARAAGAPTPIQTVIYPGAYHAWTVPDLTTARFYPDLVSTKKCPLLLLGPNRPALLIDGEPKPFDPAAFGACLAAAPGYSMGFDAAVRAQSIADTISFLQRTLRP